MRLGPAWRCVASELTLAACLGCSSVPQGRRAIDSVDVYGAKQVSERAIKERIATQASPRFLLFRGVYAYRLFDRYVFEKDLARIERFYRARGYYQARVRAGRVLSEDDEHVRVSIVVEEGPPVRVGGIALRGLENASEPIRRAAREALEAHLRRGVPLTEEAFTAAETGIQRALLDRGYPDAKVTGTAQVDLPRSFAMLAFDATPGEHGVFGPVRIEGLGDLPERPVRGAMALKEGQPYSRTALDDAERAVLDLGAFSSVTITRDLSRAGAKPGVVPLVARLTPAKLHSLRLGGGFHHDPVQTDVHGLAGYEHRNFLGGLRQLTVELRPGLAFHPAKLPFSEVPKQFLPKARVSLGLRQPAFIERRTNGFITNLLSVYPVLLTPEFDEEVPTLGYFEVQSAVGVDRKLGRHFARLAQVVTYDVPVAYTKSLDPALNALLISSSELQLNLDFRDDPLAPRSGLYVGNDLRFAGLGGDVRDVRLQPEVRGFVPLPARTVLVLRATTGLLFPGNYSEPTPDQDRAEWARNSEIFFFRGFYSGGANSNRGYPPRGIGPQGPIPFYAPDLSTALLETGCAPGTAAFDEQICQLPLGGSTLWEASLEFRFPISDPWFGNVFCDASDVTAGELEFRADHPHLSCGLGVRIESPFGPIGADVGYRIPGMQVLDDSEPEASPSTILGLPISTSLSIGEAF